MEKIDYGDINKFLVSTGLVLVSLAIVTPYLYLKEDFGLYIEQDKLAKFQQPIQDIIATKRIQVSEIQKYVPWVSLSLFVLGLILSIVGLVRWFKRQSKIDEKFDKEIRKLDLEIISLTPEEKEIKADKEVKEIEAEEQLQANLSTKTPVTHSQSFLNYMKVEQNLIQIFNNHKGLGYEVLPQQRIGNAFDIDLLLKSKSKRLSDKLIEIKYFNNQIPFSIIHRTLHQLNTYIDYYQTATNKRVVPILLIVYKKDNIAADKLFRYRSKIADYAESIPNMKNLIVEFIEENKINDFDIQGIIKE